MKKIISLFLVVFIIFSFASCSADKKTAKAIIGTWTDVLNESNSVTFNEDNTGSISSKDFSNYPITWETDDSTIVVSTFISTETIKLNLVEEDGMTKIISEDGKTAYVSKEDYSNARAKALEERKANTTQIEVNKKYEDAEYANFTVVKITSSEKITSSMNGTFTYNAGDGKVYIDVVMDYTNNTQNAIEYDDAISFAATKDDGPAYIADDFYAETDNGTSIESYGEIAPLSTVRLHCACEVPKGEGKYSLELDVNGKLYGYDYTLNEVVRNAKTIKINDVLENEDVAKVSFKSVKFTDDLLPSNTSGFYTHYNVDDSSNTYLVVSFDVTNTQSTAREVDSFVNVTATFMNKYTYTGFIIAEDTDGKGFSSYEDLDPLSTRKVHCLIEIPKSVKDSAYELCITFAGDEYLFNG